MPQYETNLVKGNVAKQLILFALPFLISNIIQSLYSVADMIIVGQFCGTVSMSGVNIGSQVTMLITNFVMGLSVGATVLIAQYLGAGDHKALRETVGTFFTTLIVLSVVFTVSMIFLRDPLLRLIRTPEESFTEASAYFRITMYGTFFIFGYNGLSAVLRGMGDSKRPLIFVAIACFVNVGLDLLLVAGFRMGAAGAALATVVSQAVSMLLCVFYLRGRDFVFDFKLRSFGFVRERLKMLLTVGLPTSIQNVATSVSFLFLTGLVNTIGVTASAAVGAVGKLNGFAILPAIAMSASVSAMSAQNIGAGEQKRASQTMGIGMAIALCISVVIFFLLRAFPETCLRAFDDDPEMIRLGAVYLKSFSFDYLLVPFVFCFNGLFTGAGHTTFTLINNALASIFMRIPACYLLGMVLDLGLPGVGLGAPIATAFSLILCVIFYLSGRWKRMVIVHRPAPAAASEE